MCGFCKGSEKIEREFDLLESSRTKTSLSIDEDEKYYKLRVVIGSIGYTLPIIANYCMFCGGKLN